MAHVIRTLSPEAVLGRNRDPVWLRNEAYCGIQSDVVNVLYCFRVWVVLLSLSVIWNFNVLYVSGYGLSCYYCHSAEAGCGKELSIRLERWHSCPDVRAGGGENFCVKLIEKRGSKSEITCTDSIS